MGTSHANCYANQQANKILLIVVHRIRNTCPYLIMIRFREEKVEVESNEPSIRYYCLLPVSIQRHLLAGSSVYLIAI